jgi:hypothetical protein
VLIAVQDSGHRAGDRDPRLECDETPSGLLRDRGNGQVPQAFTSHRARSGPDDCSPEDCDSALLNGEPI